MALASRVNDRRRAEAADKLKELEALAALIANAVGKLFGG